MKKIILVLLSVMALSLSGCGENANGTYKRVHIIGRGCYELISFSNISTLRTELNIKGYGKVVMPKTEFVLVSNKCPYCGN